MSEPLHRPNILFINTDQQRYDTLGCTGSTVARTPHLDQMAREGVRFDRCYTPHPVCMPARASFFTGQYPSHHGTWHNGVPLNPASDTIQQRFNDAGYHTALIGKIHLDTIWQRSQPHPPYGFQTLIECEGDPFCKDDYFQWLEQHGLYDDYMRQFKEQGHIDGYTRAIDADKHMNQWVTDHTIDYLNQRAADAQPFFLSMGFFDPHHPFDPCEPYASMFDERDMPMPVGRAGEEADMPPPPRRIFDQSNKAQWRSEPRRVRQTIAAYHAMVAHIDAMVGRVMDTLKQTGLERNTVVVFTSDHGEMLGDHGLLHKGAIFYEGAVRVPMLWRFPRAMGVVGVDDGYCSHVDLAPTFAALAGIEPPANAQGRALFDANGTRRPAGTPDAALVEWRDEPEQDQQRAQQDLIGRCLITDDWKYVYYQDRAFGELYDRAHDPDELHNRWTDPACAETKRQLHEQLLRFMLEQEPRPTKVDVV